MIFDTIVGISTKLGESAINVIRVSGDDAFEVVNKIFKGPNLLLAKSHTIQYGYIYDGDRLLDEVLVNLYRAPKSFTAEDMIEINCHGGHYIANEIVKTLLKNGVRLALNGEFTRRAYLLGRIDLTEAEGVMDVINAKNKTQLDMAHMQLRGDVYTLVNSLQDELLDIIAGIEVNIDYPEYDDAITFTQELIKPRLETFITKIQKIIKQSNTGRVIRDGIDTVIVGKPNVGKSSLLNSLLKEEKAIVTDISGTTRDLIEAELNLNGVILNLIDTAGIRDTVDTVEKIGIERSRKAIGKASLVLLVLDQSQSLTESDHELLELTKDKTRILVGNKIDLGKKFDIENETIISISAKNQTNLEALENEVKKKFIDSELIDNHEVLLSNTRHISKVEEALDRLYDAMQATNDAMPVDMIEIDIRAAWNLLGEITGEMANDSLIDQLFSKFCLGK